MSDEPAKAIANRLVCGGLLDPSQRSVDANTSIISDKLASLTDELADSRAREVKMREALEGIASYNIGGNYIVGTPAAEREDFILSARAVLRTVAWDAQQGDGM